MKVGAAGANEIFYDVEYDQIDGGTIQVGQTGTAPNTDIWLVKLNAQNQIVWQNTIVNTGEDVIYKAKVCVNGDYLICGWFSINGSIRGFAARINRVNGNFIWMRTTNGVDSSYGERFYDVAETTNGNIALVGAYNYQPGNPSLTQGLFVLLNSAGADLNLSRSRNGNSKFYGQSIFYTVNQLPNNGALLLGGHYWSANGNYNSMFIEVNETNTISIAQNSYTPTGSVPWNNNLNSHWPTKAFTINGSVKLEMIATTGCCDSAGTQVIYDYNTTTRALTGNLLYYLSNPIPQSNTPTSITCIPISDSDIIITQSVPTTGGVNNFVSRIVNNVSTFDRKLINPISNIYGSASSNGYLALSGATSGTSTDAYAFINSVNVPTSGTPCVIQNSTPLTIVANNPVRAVDNVPFVNRTLMVAFSPVVTNVTLPLTDMCPNPCCNLNNADESKKMDNILNRLAAVEKELAETKSSINEMNLVLDKNNIVVLGQNTPNPFHESTKISYFIPKKVTKAQIVISTTTGIVLKTLELKSFGNGEINVYASDLSSGMYIYSLYIDGKMTESKKMTKL